MSRITISPPPAPPREIPRVGQLFTHSFYNGVYQLCDTKEHIVLINIDTGEPWISGKTDWEAAMNSLDGTWIPLTGRTITILAS